MARRDATIVSAIMRRVRGRDTGPELDLRRALWADGYRYRVHATRLPGKPDIIFPRERVAVFIDGDFWHGNQWRLRGLSSLEEQFKGSRAAEYWIPKIRRNMVRDIDATARLEYDGWKVVRVWESDIRRDLAACAQQVEECVIDRRQEGRG